MAKHSFEDYATNYISSAINRRVEDLKKEIMEEAQLKFRHRLTELISSVSLDLIERVNISMDRQELLIRADISKLKESYGKQ